MHKLTAILLRHWKSLLGFNVLVVVATIIAVASAPKVWTATGQLILPDTTSNLDANLGTLGSLSNSNPFSTQVNPLKVQASILTSDTLLDRVWTFDPQRKKEAKPRGYGKLFQAIPQEQSSIISLAVTGSSPDIARQRAIAWMQAYQQRLNELRQANSFARQQYSQKELDQAKANLTQAQVALAQFQASSGLVNSEDQTKGIVATINTLTAAQATALAQARAGQNRVSTLSTRLNLNPSQGVRSLSLGENSSYQFTRQRLAQVEAELVQARSTFSDQHPRVQELLEQRSRLQQQLQQYVTQTADGERVDPSVSGGDTGRANLIQQLVLAESEAKAQQQQAEQLQRQIDKLNADLLAIPKKQAKLLELQRQYEVAEGVYKGLIAQIKQSSIDGFNAYPNVQILDPSTVDLKATSPKKLLAALNALMASIVGSIALILLLEARNPLLSPKDLQAFKFPLVVRIPRLRQTGKLVDLHAEPEVEFQRLASAVSLQSISDHRLLITSAIAEEGKTTIILGLAIALADLGFRVLMVDGDFRQAELSRRLGYLQQPTANQPIPIKTGVDLLPTQPRKGKIAELIRRGQFEQSLTIAQSTNDYDYVLIDSAPVSLTSETALMGAVIPNVLLVIRPGMSKRNAVNDSLDQLLQHNARILGLVVNGEETQTRPYADRTHDALVTS